MITACLDSEGEGIQKKRPDRDWLRRRAEGGSYAGIVTELAGLFVMSEWHWKIINIVFIVAKLGNIVSPSDAKAVSRKLFLTSLKMFLTSGENMFCFRNMCFPRVQTGKHLPPQQCFLVLPGLKRYQF